LIRLININDQGVVTLTDERLSEYVKGTEYAVQRFMIAFFNTPRTMVDDPSFGGGGKLQRGKKLIREESRIRAYDAVSRAAQSLLPLEEDVIGDPRITGVTMIGWAPLARGSKISVRLDFDGSSSTTFSFGA